MEVRVGPSVVTVHLDDEVLISDAAGLISSEAQQGYFIADTRLVSGYRLKIGRGVPILLNSSQVDAHSARFEFTNPQILADDSYEIPESTLHLRLDRVLGRGVHEDYELTNYCGHTIDLVIEVSVESDFADLFDVKDQRLQRRGLVRSTWDARGAVLRNDFTHEGFTRGLLLEARHSEVSVTYANGGLFFPVKLQHGATWRSCLLWRPVLDSGSALPTIIDCHRLLRATEAHPPEYASAARVKTSDPLITATIGQAIGDLTELRMRTPMEPRLLDVEDQAALAPERLEEEDNWVLAAGIPWFATLFGRDALVASLQCLPVSYHFAEGNLRALSILQATGTDDDRDMQPGKIEHEIRRGELARLRLVPHTPYYGSHDATPLFVLVAAATWRWHGVRRNLDQLRPHVEAALAWIDRDGDLDADGLQEYATRSSRGYFNQGWKDARDAILHSDGSLPELPIATCELQGVVVACKRAWAEVLEQAYGEDVAAKRLRTEAERLAGLIEERFWWEAEGTYYLGLDGRKRPIETVASNPGHLLYFRAIDTDRAASVARRLFEEDMWSGWGIRTLSERHQSYNPFSYQLGSVWPHDNVLIARGLRSYGFDVEAHRIARALLDAADCLVNRRLPELFAGLRRDSASFPVQYVGANVPQAWASGAVIHLLDVFCGFEADAVGGRLSLRPALPSWLPQLEIESLLFGGRKIDLLVRRVSDGSHELQVSGSEELQVHLSQ